MATQRLVAVLFLLWGCCSRASATATPLTPPTDPIFGYSRPLILPFDHWVKSNKNLRDTTAATAITVPTVEESTRVSGTSAANTTTARGADLTPPSTNLTSTSANLTSTSANLTSTAEGTTTRHPTTASRVSETSALAGSEGNTTQVTNATSSPAVSSSATSSPAVSSSATSNATSTKAPSSKPSRNESSTSLAPSSSIKASVAPKPTVSWTTTNSSGTAQQQPLSQRNPGLIVVLCIFAAVLAIVLAVVIVKVCQRGGPQFKRLDELPMNGVNEEAPFARYPPK